MAARRAQHAGSGAAQSRTARPAAPAGDDSALDPSVSDDDEDISDLSAVGQPVIAEVLGGVVIDVTEE